MKQTLFILLFPCIVYSTYAQPAGFDEEIIPSPNKVNCVVKAIKVSIYYPESIGDTLGNGTPCEIENYKFDSAGRLLQTINKQVKCKRYDDIVTTYRYFGKDSVIISEPRGRNYVHKIKVVNKFKNYKRPVSQDFFVSEYSALRKPVKFLGRVENFYDSHGFLIKQIHYGTPDQHVIVTEYKNDTNGNHLAIIPPSLNPLTDGGDSKQRNFVYDEFNNPIRTDDMAYRYKYDSKGNWIERISYLKMQLNSNTHGFSQIVRRKISYQVGIHYIYY